ncbi:M15 family metallopeptidase [Paenibacillus glycinis]|uniref:M15 family metallopeptidase n=1 Tax=Paenibacillus glycinis TaxID=2697035 RepID=UPI002E2B237C|nr:M15 family metallopeptidase [Paenibacillus glycinis]
MKKWLAPLLLAGAILTLTACDGWPLRSTAAGTAGSVASGSGHDAAASEGADNGQAPGKNAGSGAGQHAGQDAAAGNPGTGPGKNANGGAGVAPGKADAAGGANARETVAEPDSVTALVNKRHMLPDDYVPDDLVYPDVKFTFSEKIEKRMMRKEAAEALERLFAAAKKDGKPLAGVSAYRSHKRQKELFDSYVREDGREKAETYSAFPGTSEHETGLAIDVSGADGACQATACFADKPEAAWLAEHAYEYGFIVRYPKDKEGITGYIYEPWHLRYVGDDTAKAIHDQGITLEEYENAIEASTTGAGS